MANMKFWLNKYIGMEGLEGPDIFGPLQFCRAATEVPNNNNIDSNLVQPYCRPIIDFKNKREWTVFGKVSIVHVATHLYDDKLVKKGFDLYEFLW